MLTRKFEWFDKEKQVPVYGVQVYHEGKWKHAALNGKAILCYTEEERDEKRKLLKKQIRGK